MRKRNNNRRKKKPISMSAMMTIVALVIAGIYMATTARSRHDGDVSIDQMPAVSQLLKVDIPDSVPQQVVQYEGMDVNFNSALHIPNCVSWELTADETTGHAKRHNRFMNDPDVKGCPETWDYSYSGYDRGHMAPAGDMKWDAEAMRQTFYLSNICPQDHQLNTGAWNRLEGKCRQWAKRDSAIIIVCGPVITDHITEYIGDTRVAVPKRFFKVILSPYTTPARGIGFIMPNGPVPGGMQHAAVSIDSVEAVTGYDFFSALPDDIESIVEQQSDFYKWDKAQ